MKRIAKNITLLLILTAALMMLGACMRMVRIEPPGFAEAMADFELMDVEVRHISYFPPPNQIRVELYVDGDVLTEEIWQHLSEAIWEYMRSEQFIDFMESLGEDVDLDTLSRNTHLFDFDGVHIP